VYSCSIPYLFVYIKLQKLQTEAGKNIKTIINKKKKMIELENPKARTYQGS
jgi:hypothetical protein